MYCGSSEKPLYTGGRLMRSEANRYKQSYQCLSTQQIYWSVIRCQWLPNVPPHLVESLVCKCTQNNHETNALLRLRDWGPAHSFWKTDPPPHLKRRKHHRHYWCFPTWWNWLWCIRIFLGIFSVKQRVCSCWFLRSLDTRNTIPILSILYELVLGNFYFDSNQEDEKYVLSRWLYSFPLKKKVFCNYINYPRCLKRWF